MAEISVKRVDSIQISGREIAQVRYQDGSFPPAVELRNSLYISMKEFDDVMFKARELIGCDSKDIIVTRMEN